MATFPALTPNARSLSLGNYPQLEYTGVSGGSIRFLQNTLRVAQTLTLTYNAITEADLYLIRDHFETQQGTLIPFDLPAAVWAGYSTVPISQVDYEWRYAGTFSVEPNTPGRFNVEVQLESSLV